ncbi:ECF transporter S component [Anaerocolumna xylanovorans]|uniref:Uridine kinase n=1 Tax=Anaerocolumna xylanovorans DSM 12503 TaxID=1121345 RepID=A0A1M7Y0Z8_9FIRM|nr:ECF transporter S component [Anaerocolumna xylanovorans]SHO45387.1 Uridine kinase [Anaerocolumna xylanovorans DSM 12503]
MRTNRTNKLVLSALFIAIGIILPFVTLQIPSIGNMLLPMHIPVILCGFICGGPYGLIVGFILPLLRSILFGMPPLMPTAVSMSFELATYGLISGIIYQRIAGKRFAAYISLIGAMIAGRIVWGAVSFGLYTLLGNIFTWKIFAMQAVINAIPGIIIQLVLIPLLVSSLKHAGVIRHLSKNEKLDMKAACANRFEPVLTEVNNLLKSNKDNLMIAIDGKCASGKTTLAYYLQSVYDCNLFHMDDFFLREEQKTESRINEIGGNVDYERFKTEVINKLLKKQDVEYTKYSCDNKSIEKSVAIMKHKHLNIIEGSYSQHPYFGNIYDLKIFMDIDDNSQIDNIRKRNGEEKLKRFISEWIPKENAYFNKFAIKEESVIIKWQ